MVGAEAADEAPPEQVERGVFERHDELVAVVAAEEETLKGDERRKARKAEAPCNVPVDASGDVQRQSTVTDTVRTLAGHRRVYTTLSACCAC